MIRMWASRLVVAMMFTHAAVYPTQAAVSFQTGSELLEDCSANKEPGWGVCHGFIIAVGSSSDCQNSFMGEFYFSLPEGATAGQIKKIVIKYLNEHPEKLHLPAAPLAAAALSEAFPCQ